MLQLWERIRDWVVLAILLGSAILVMLVQNDALFRGMRAASLDITSRVEARFHWVGNFLRAVEENEQLRLENMELSSEVARSRQAQLENEQLRSMLDLEDTAEHPLLPAQVVGRDLANQQNLLTLDVGTEDGVEEGMAVITEDGVVGRVVLVSDRYARVMPLLHTDFRVTAMVQPSQSTGIVSWPGTNPNELLLEYVVNTEDVDVGEQVVTSRESRTFPEGHPIGTIDSISTLPGRHQLNIHLSPAVPIHQTTHVFVVLAKPDPEQMDLEDQEIR